MAVFYVLPPRAMVAERAGLEWSRMFPGLDVNEAVAAMLPYITDTLEERADVHVIFREDLVGEQDTMMELIDGFGAESGDQLVEVRWPEVTAVPSVRVWRIPEIPPCSEVGEIAYNETVSN